MATDMFESPSPHLVHRSPGGMLVALVWLSADGIYDAHQRGQCLVYSVDRGVDKGPDIHTDSDWPLSITSGVVEFNICFLIMSR